MTGSPLVINGWSVFAHPLFLDQIEILIAEVEKARAKDAKNYRRKSAAKRLAAITKLAFEIIPQAPDRPEYRQGNTLGEERRHWFRAKFFQQYRLFFRFSAAQRVIIYAWVNDENTLRAYDRSSGAYLVFSRMIARGAPPDDWTRLEAEARATAARLQEAASQLGSQGEN